MPILLANCPRCHAQKTTFDYETGQELERKFDWQFRCEAFCVCRNCHRATIFVISVQRPLGSGVDHWELIKRTHSLNDYFRVDDFISLKDFAQVPPPEHLPAEIKAAFEEGATCAAVKCYNAAATMFRLCIDHATRALLPKDNSNGLNQSIRYKLGARLTWLFDNQKLPESLRELSTCVKEDGNDGAHVGSLIKDDAEDLVEFTHILLERLYTEPEKLRLAQQRRDLRRNPQHTQIVPKAKTAILQKNT